MYNMSKADSKAGLILGLKLSSSSWIIGGIQYGLSLYNENGNFTNSRISLLVVASFMVIMGRLASLRVLLRLCVFSSCLCLFCPCPFLCRRLHLARGG